MARRRLSDLLREEANKPSDETKATAGAEQPTDEPDAETSGIAEETAPIASNSVPRKTTTAAKNAAAKRTAATESKGTSAQKQDEAVLQQQITDLTTALNAQKETVEKLQTELGQVHTLKMELEETRKELHQLTQANASLTQELKTLRTSETTVDTYTSTATEMVKVNTSHELHLAPPPDSAEVFEEPLNSSFNRDVGWFD